MLEKSCGAVVYKKKSKKYFFLIEKMKLGHFALPKGHIEKGESEIQCAIRKVKEETNLDIIIQYDFKEKIQYSLKNGNEKEVIYFLAQCEKVNLKAQESEIAELYLLPFNEAYQRLTYQNDKDVLLKAYLYLIKKECQKIIVLGCPGSGKSYLSKYLAKYTGFPFYHLDLLYWYGNWQHIQEDEFIFKQKKIMQTPKWLIDGHFQSTIEERIKNCDIAFYFYFPPQMCIRGVQHRIKYHSTREDMPTSCKEFELSEKFENCIRHFRQKNNPTIQKYFKLYGCNVLTIYSKKQLKTIIQCLNTKN